MSPGRSPIAALLLVNGAIFVLALGALLLARPQDPSPLAFAAVGILLGCACSAWLLLRARRAAAALAAELESRKRAEQGARAANLAKGQLLANASHEIRTPMNGVLGMADLLLQSELTAAQREQVELIRTSAEALLVLVDDILDVSRVEAGRLLLRPRDFHLRDLVSEVVRLLAPQAAARGIDLHLSVAAGLPDDLHGDPMRLRQVLINLVGNAVRHTREGSVAVAVEAREGRGGAPEIRFEVRDTGTGIRPAVQARLFRPFAQAESSSSQNLGGVGLGLVISKSIVDLMGGEIGFESTYGAGSTFWFQLPLVAAQAAPVSLPAASHRGDDCTRGTRRGARVLVVDDHPVNRALALAQLLEIGYSADAAESGEEALKLLAERTYDAVLLDCAMPELDGYETCRRLRAREGNGRRTPVIALTAFAGVGERERCLAAGMDEYLAKPYKGEDLTAILDHWLGLAPPMPEPCAAERLDERLAAFQRLGEIQGEDVLEQVKKDFLGRGAQDLEALEAALARGDGEAVAAAAHSLAGSSGILGAAALAARCAELEALARQGDLAACGPRLQAVEREYRAVEGRLAT
ncbi:MAG TPA: ATP-binding protein [Thermoanaerobaculia bacterium]|nr:ATP-binding protein [Thermoanaerobaculia bacterium]